MFNEPYLNFHLQRVYLRKILVTKTLDGERESGRFGAVLYDVGDENKMLKRKVKSCREWDVPKFFILILLIFLNPGRGEG